MGPPQGYYPNNQGYGAYPPPPTQNYGGEPYAYPPPPPPHNNGYPGQQGFGW